MSNTNVLFMYLKSIRQTQVTIANKVGINQSVVSDLINGKRKMSEKLAYQFENAYNIRHEWLLDNEGPMLTDGTTPDIETSEREEIIRLTRVVQEQQRTIDKLVSILQESYKCSTEKK